MPEFDFQPIPQTSLAEPSGISDSTREYLQQAYRPNTVRAYKTGQGQWEAHAEENRLTAYPAAPSDLANFLSARAKAGQSLSTLRAVLAAVKAKHDAKGFAFDSRAPVLTKTLKGIGNATARLPRQAAPLRAADVLDLIANCEDTALGRRDAAAIALGYIFAARRSELVRIDLEEQGTGDAVLRIGVRSLELILGQSKTTANGEPEIVVIPRAENAVAVSAIERWIEAANVQPGEPLLRGVASGGKIAPPVPEGRGGNKDRPWGGHMHAQSFATILKNRIATHHEKNGVSRELARKDAERFSGHSLRVGFITTAAEGGADVRAIAAVSRHRSLSMVQRYSARADQLRTAPHRLPGVGLSGDKP